MSHDTAVLRTAAIAEARTWLGTPFAHQQRRKGFGVDCIGVPAEVGKALGLPFCEGVPTAYTRAPNPRELLRELHGRLDSVPFRDKRPADLFLCRGGGPEPSHLAMITALDPLTVLHASMIVGRVTEHHVDRAWLARVVQTFRYRGLGV